MPVFPPSRNAKDLIAAWMRGDRLAVAEAQAVAAILAMSYAAGLARSFEAGVSAR